MRLAGHAVRMSTLDAIRNQKTTKDLGGSLTCSDFTEVVVDRLPIFITSDARTLDEFYANQ